jgi:hypothetical protein
MFETSFQMMRAQAASQARIGRYSRPADEVHEAARSSASQIAVAVT